MQNQAEIFAELRPALLKLARRILGGKAEAEDLVHEAYLRWAQSTVGEVRSPRSFLATIVTRLCLNHLNLARVCLEHEDAPLLLSNLSSAARGPGENVALADAIGRDFAWVALTGRTATGAVLLSVSDRKIAAVRLVRCPVLLQELEVLMTFSSGGDGSPASIPKNN